MRYLLLAGFVSACTLAAQSAPGAGSIAGHVFNLLTGAPIRKATVTLTAPEIRLIADTDSDGRFQFTALPPGTYRLSASRLGFLDHPARRPVPLGPNDQVTDAEIRLPPQGVIIGHVSDEDGEPVDRARVMIFKQVYRDGRKRWERLNGAETNDAGEYRVPNLAPGRYILQAHNQRPPINNQYGNPPKMFYVPAYYPNAPSQQQAVPVEVGTGSEVRDIDIHLFRLARPPSVRVRGKVIGVPPGPQTVISVSLLSADGGFFGGNVIAHPPDYAFELTPPPGEYTIVGSVYSGAQGAYGTGRLTVAGDLSGVVLTMSPAAEIRGRISLAEGGGQAKLQGVRVTLELEDAPDRVSAQTAQSDAAGRFAFGRPFRPGRYMMNVRSIPDGCFVRDVKLGGQPVSPGDFEMLASAQLELVLGNTAGTIGGSVSDADGKPFPGSSVTLIPQDSKSRPVRQAVDDDGKFRFTGLRPGKYKLFAWEEVDDDVWQDPEFRKNFESHAVEITVGPSEAQNAQLRVIPAAH